MAEPGRTVRVTGLPTDMEDDRLRDKLELHFLRTRNGGGEIDSVTIVKTAPVCALVTFEDSRVAQRVIQHSRHVLDVDGRQWRLTVTEHHEILIRDEVIPHVSATVDCSQLPGGVMALTSLQMSHPDIQINHEAAVNFCTVHGAYTKVQAALVQLLSHPGGLRSADSTDTAQAASSSSSAPHMEPDPRTQPSQSHRRKLSKAKEQKKMINNGRPPDEYDSASQRIPMSGACSSNDADIQIEGAALQLSPESTMSEEDFSLIVDAEVFQYLQKHCRKEYQDILSIYGVDVVDMTNQGLTSLFLHVATGAEEGGPGQESLKLARMAISTFFQENQTKIHRSQLPKSILPPGEGQQRLKENLSVTFPKVLLTEDDKNIYVIGSRNDVSEAKQFLLDQNEATGKKEDVASLLRFPSYGSGSTPGADEHRVPLSAADEFIDNGIDRLLGSEDDERRADGSRRYKLAARFKETGLAALGNRPTDFSFRGGLSPLRRSTDHGPMLGHDVLSETAGASRASVQKTGKDILFKTGDSTFPKQNKPLLDSQPKDMKSKPSTAPCSSSGVSPLPPAGSGSALKRASSFSGTPQQKAQVVSQRSRDDTYKSTMRSRSSSSSTRNQTMGDKQGGYSAEVSVSSIMWMHIKEAYCSRVDDLTCDVQMKEKQSKGPDVTLTIRGADSSRVSACQAGLHKLVDFVKLDFSVQNLLLSELSISDPADDTLQLCCFEVRSRFKKVTIQVGKKSLLLLGPQLLCSQVAASLREVFSGDSVRIPEQKDSTSPRNPSTLKQMNENKGSRPHCSGDPQVKLLSQTKPSDVTQDWRRHHRTDFEETQFVNGPTSVLPVRKEPVIKEKVQNEGSLVMDVQKTDKFISQSKAGKPNVVERVNGAGTTMNHPHKDVPLYTKEKTSKDNAVPRQTACGEAPEESRAGSGGVCVCGRTDRLMKTQCGVTMCSRCLEEKHFHCRVCLQAKPSPRGVCGRMSHSSLHMSVPGHPGDSVIKITYRIPDGIQDDGHPAPGRPFLGGVFEAFLPDCDKSRKLLPRLEKAFVQGLTFTVKEKETGGQVTWDRIPHKTSVHGGKSGNGYPDSSYLSRLSQVLIKLIEEL